MKKTLKWIGISLISLLVLLFLLPFIISTFFKEDIKRALDKEMKKNIDAQVVIDINKLDLSLFRNFPNVTVSLDEFGVVGNEPFQGDTLLFADHFRLTLDLMSVLSGGQMELKTVIIEKPTIHAKILPDGKANWDIYIGETTEEENPDSASIKLDIDHWEINKGKLVYEDQSTDMYAEVSGLQHSGSGVIDEKYILETMTEIEALSFSMDGVPYLSEHYLESELNATIDLKKMNFHFDENFLKLNNFQFNFDGDVTLIDSTTTAMDVTFGTKETDFKEVLSLVPAIYLSEEFEKLKTSGSFSFGGFVKGDLSDITIPKFDVALKINDGFFQYPDLPAAVSDVLVDLEIKNTEGVVDYTKIDLNQLHLMLADNPVDAVFHLEDLVDMNFDAMMKAKFKLQDIASFYPIEDVNMKGLFETNLNAHGKIDTTFEKLPTVNGFFNLTNGYVKSGDYPALEEIVLKSNVFSDGNMSTSKAKVDALNFTLDGDRFESKMIFENFDDIRYNIQANGKIDIEKMLNIAPIEDMTIKGIITIKDFQTKGKQSDVMNENFLALDSRGKGEVKDFYYNDVDKIMLEGFRIESATFEFDPKQIKVSEFKGKLSKSDLSADGNIGNYMGYLFSETDTIINGYFNLHSNKFDIDEWMVEEESATLDTSAEELELVPIPQNINFKVDAIATEIMYDGVAIKNASGNMKIYEGICEVSNVKCEMLGGKVNAESGSYNTKDLTHPSVSYKMNIQNMEIKQAYAYFNTFKKYAPAAEKMNGSFSGRMNLFTELKNDYMPKYPTLDADGVFTLKGATFKADETKIVKAITQQSKFNIGELNLSDKSISFTIVDGKLKVKPFSISKGSSNLLFDLSKGIDGSILHNIKMELPAKLVPALTKLTGSDKVNLGFLVTGTEADPKVKMDGGKAITDNVKDVVDKKKQEQIDKIMAEANARAEKIRKEGKAAGDNIRKEAKTQADRVRQETNTAAENLRKEGYAQAEKLKFDPLIKKAKKETDDKVEKLKKEGESKAREIENKADQKAQQLENEADNQANNIIKQAENKTANL